MRRKRRSPKTKSGAADKGGRWKKDERGPMPEVAARRSARGSTHWKWKVDLRTRPILTQSSFLRVRGGVGARGCRACVRHRGIPTTRHLSSGPPAAGGIESANRQRRSRGGKKKEEERRKRARRKIGEYGRKFCDELVVRELAGKSRKSFVRSFVK